MIARTLPLFLLALLAACSTDSVRRLGPGVEPWAGELPGRHAWNRSVRLLAVGHAYGDFRKRSEASPGPAANLAAHAEELAALEPGVVLGLGDLVYAFDPRCVDPTVAVLERLRAPVLNAPGNHDLGDPAAYRARFGEPFGAVRIGGAVLFLLDAESTPWHLGEAQRAFVVETARRELERGARHLVLAIHKLAWTVGDERLDPVLARVNAHDGFAGSSDVPELVRDLEGLVATVAEGASSDEPGEFGAPGRPALHVLSGDLGAPHSLPFFFEPRANGVRAATGLGERTSDCALLAELHPDGTSTWRLVPLGPDAPTSLADGALERWRELPGAPALPQGAPPPLPAGERAR